MKRLLLPGLLALLSACPGPQKNGEQPTGPGDLAVAVRIQGDQDEGDIGRFTVTLTNRSDRYLLLRDLVAAGTEDATGTWQIPLPGEVAYRKEADVWVYTRKAAGTPRPVFNCGLLAPGEQVSFRTRVRLLDLPRRFTLRYYRYDREEIARRVYFEKRVEKETRYTRFIGDELDVALIPSKATDVASHRTVIFPYADQVTTSPLEESLTLAAESKPRKFRLPAALAKVGIARADEVTFWSELGLWVIRAGDQVWLVSEPQTIEFPRTKNLTSLFYFLDVGDHPKVEVEFLKETKTVFAERYKLAAAGQRYFAFLERGELLEFFRFVREYDLELDVELQADGGGRLRVTR